MQETYFCKKGILKKFFPILTWLPNYSGSTFKSDFIAGITVSVLLIPQGMAYALIAGLPPIYGLYAALSPQIIYAILGTSRQLAVGPVAMDSLLVAAGLGTISKSLVRNAGARGAIPIAITSGTQTTRRPRIKRAYTVHVVLLRDRKVSTRGRHYR